MSNPPSADSISKSEFQEILSRYPSLVPEKLKALDEKRLHTIPDRVEERKHAKKDGFNVGAYLSKEEVLDLVDWKLSHGTYRPRLRDMVASNVNFDESTHDTFCRLRDVDPSMEDTHIFNAMNLLQTFKGIGPATASLLLSTLDKDKFPFFGDELFRWVMWDGKGTPWETKIKYTNTEYMALVPRAREVAKRLGVGVRDVECAAWVLGREWKEGKKGDKGGKKADAEKGAGQKRASANKSDDAKAVVSEKKADAEKVTSSKDEKTKSKTAEKHTNDDSSLRRSKRLKTAD